MGSNLKALVAALEAIDADETRLSVTESELKLREAVVEFVNQHNENLAPERQISLTAALTVVDRHIAQNLTAEDPREWMFFAAREVAHFVDYAAGIQASATPRHQDLLPVGHPESTNPALNGMSEPFQRVNRGRWFAADPRVDNQARKAVYEAYATVPGTPENTFALARLEALTAGLVPVELVIKPLVAAFGVGNPFAGNNSSMARSARAKLQRRDRKGRFAEMGGGARFFANLKGAFKSVTGKFAGVPANSSDLEVEVLDNADLPDGIYSIPASRIEGLKAVLDLKPGTAKQGLVNTQDQKLAISEADLLASRKDAPTGWTANGDGSYTSADGYTATPVKESVPAGTDVLIPGDRNEYDLKDPQGNDILRVTGWANVQKFAAQNDAKAAPRVRARLIDGGYNKRGPEAGERPKPDQRIIDRVMAEVDARAEAARKAARLPNQGGMWNRPEPEVWDGAGFDQAAGEDSNVQRQLDKQDRMLALPTSDEIAEAAGDFVKLNALQKRIDDLQKSQKDLPVDATRIDPSFAQKELDDAFAKIGVIRKGSAASMARRKSVEDRLADISPERRAADTDGAYDKIDKFVEAMNNAESIEFEDGSEFSVYIPENDDYGRDSDNFDLEWAYYDKDGNLVASDTFFGVPYNYNDDDLKLAIKDALDQGFDEKISGEGEGFDQAAGNEQFDHVSTDGKIQLNTNYERVVEDDRYQTYESADGYINGEYFPHLPVKGPNESMEDYAKRPDIAAALEGGPIGYRKYQLDQAEARKAKMEAAKAEYNKPENVAKREAEAAAKKKAQDELDAARRSVDTDGLYGRVDEFVQAINNDKGSVEDQDGDEIFYGGWNANYEDDETVNFEIFDKDGKTIAYDGNVHIDDLKAEITDQLDRYFDAKLKEEGGFNQAAGEDSDIFDGEADEDHKAVSDQLDAILDSVEGDGTSSDDLQNVVENLRDASFVADPRQAERAVSEYEINHRGDDKLPELNKIAQQIRDNHDALNARREGRKEEAAQERLDRFESAMDDNNIDELEAMRGDRDFEEFHDEIDDALAEINSSFYEGPEEGFDQAAGDYTDEASFDKLAKDASGGDEDALNALQKISNDSSHPFSQDAEDILDANKDNFEGFDQGAGDAGPNYTTPSFQPDEAAAAEAFDAFSEWDKNNSNAEFVSPDGRVKIKKTVDFNEGDEDRGPYTTTRYAVTVDGEKIPISPGSATNLGQEQGSPEGVKRAIDAGLDPDYAKKVSGAKAVNEIKRQQAADRYAAEQARKKKNVEAGVKYISDQLTDKDRAEIQKVLDDGDGRYTSENGKVSVSADPSEDQPGMTEWSIETDKGYATDVERAGRVGLDDIIESSADQISSDLESRGFRKEAGFNQAAGSEVQDAIDSGDLDKIKELLAGDNVSADDYQNLQLAHYELTDEFTDPEFDPIFGEDGFDQAAGGKMDDPATEAQYGFIESVLGQQGKNLPTELRDSMEEAVANKNLTKGEIGTIIGEMNKHIDPTIPTERQLASIRRDVVAKGLPEEEAKAILDSLDTIKKADASKIIDRLKSMDDIEPAGFAQEAGDTPLTSTEDFDNLPVGSEINFEVFGSDVKFTKRQNGKWRANSSVITDDFADRVFPNIIEETPGYITARKPGAAEEGGFDQAVADNKHGTSGYVAGYGFTPEDDLRSYSKTAEDGSIINVFQGVGNEWSTKRFAPGSDPVYDEPIETLGDYDNPDDAWKAAGDAAGVDFNEVAARQADLESSAVGKMAESATGAQYSLLQEYADERDSGDANFDQAIQEALANKNLTKAQMGSLINGMRDKPFKPGVNPNKPSDRAVKSLTSKLLTKDLSEEEVSDILDRLPSMNRKEVDDLNNKLRSKKDRPGATGFAQAAGEDGEFIDEGRDFKSEDADEMFSSPEAAASAGAVTPERVQDIADRLDAVEITEDAPIGTGKYMYKTGKELSDDINAPFTNKDDDSKMSEARSRASGLYEAADGIEKLDPQLADDMRKLADDLVSNTERDVNPLVAAQFDDSDLDEPGLNWYDLQEELDAQNEGFFPTDVDKIRRDLIDGRVGDTRSGGAEGSVSDEPNENGKYEASLEIGDSTGGPEVREFDDIYDAYDWVAEGISDANSSHHAVNDRWLERDMEDAAKNGTEKEFVDSLADLAEHLRTHRGDPSVARKLDEYIDNARKRLDEKNKPQQFLPENGEGGFNQEAGTAVSPKMGEPATDAQYDYLKELGDRKSDVSPELSQAIADSLSQRNLTKSQIGGLLGQLRALNDNEGFDSSKPTPRQIQRAKALADSLGLSPKERRELGLNRLASMSPDEIQKLIDNLKRRGGSDGGSGGVKPEAPEGRGPRGGGRLKPNPKGEAPRDGAEVGFNQAAGRVEDPTEKPDFYKGSSSVTDDTGESINPGDTLDVTDDFQNGWEDIPQGQMGDVSRGKATFTGMTLADFTGDEKDRNIGLYHIPEAEGYRNDGRYDYNEDGLSEDDFNNMYENADFEAQYVSIPGGFVFVDPARVSKGAIHDVDPQEVSGDLVIDDPEIGSITSIDSDGRVSKDQLDKVQADMSKDKSKDIAAYNKQLEADRKSRLEDLKKKEKAETVKVENVSGTKVFSLDGKTVKPGQSVNIGVSHTNRDRMPGDRPVGNFDELADSNFYAESVPFVYTGHTLDEFTGREQDKSLAYFELKSDIIGPSTYNEDGVSEDDFYGDPENEGQEWVAEEVVLFPAGHYILSKEDTNISAATLLRKHSNLSPEDAPKFTADESNALRQYTSVSHHDFNHPLRNKQKLNPKDQKKISDLDSAISATTAAEAFKVYRGVRLYDESEIADARDRLQVGAEIEDLGYISTSTDPAVALQFTGGAQGFPGTENYRLLPPQGVVYTINVPEGQDIADVPPSLTRFGESEMLLPRGLKFRVASVKENKSDRDGTTVFEVEVDIVKDEELSGFDQGSGSDGQGLPGVALADARTSDEIKNNPSIVNVDVKDAAEADKVVSETLTQNQKAEAGLLSRIKGWMKAGAGRWTPNFTVDRGATRDDDRVTSSNAPINPASGHVYSAQNMYALAAAADERGYADRRWMTAEQAIAQGGFIREGEKGVEILLPVQKKMRYVDENGDVQERNVTSMEKAFVFNAEQADGIGPDDLPETPGMSAGEALDFVLARFADAEDKRAGRGLFKIREERGAKGPRWSPSGPLGEGVRMPDRSQFDSPAAYIQSLFHELIHSAGFRTRMARKSNVEGLKGDKRQIALEELTAELGSAVLMQRLGIPFDEKKHAAYVDSHMRGLSEEDLNFAFMEAQSAADYTLGNDVLPKWDNLTTDYTKPARGFRPLAGRSWNPDPNLTSEDASDVYPAGTPGSVSNPEVTGFAQGAYKRDADKAVKDTRSAVEKVTEALLAALKEGQVPWRKPYKEGIQYAGINMPRNPMSKRIYSGLNAVVLAMIANARGYDDPRWMTFNQAKKAGGSVRKGEKGTMILVPKTIWKEDEKTGETKPIVLFSTAYVFNIAQIDGVDLKPLNEEAPDRMEPLDAHNFIIERYKKAMEARTGKAPEIIHDYVGAGGYQAPHWAPATDRIVLPTVDQFNSPEEMFDTLAHEMVHSTGHVDRLDRSELSRDYGNADGIARAKEELIAEIGAALLADMFGIETTLDNSAAYVKSWLQRLQSHPEEIVTAARAAQKAVDYLLGTDLGDWSPLEGYGPGNAVQQEEEA